MLKNGKTIFGFFCLYFKLIINSGDRTGKIPSKAIRPYPVFIIKLL